MVYIILYFTQAVLKLASSLKLDTQNDNEKTRLMGKNSVLSIFNLMYFKFGKFYLSFPNTPEF